MPKRIFNLLISLLVAAGDWLGGLASRLFGLQKRSRCIVLAYHSVTAKERELFAGQMDIVLRIAKPVSADIESLPSKSARYAAITFDDGFANVFENAIPELRKRNIPATLFIVTEALGTNRAWEHYGGDDTRQEPVMSVEQLRELRPELITVGSHTMNHPMLPSIEKKLLEQELAGSRAKLEQMLGREVKLFSFPYGASNPAVIDACREAGYDRVFTALPVFAFTEPREFVTGRAGVTALDWPVEFRLKLLGAYRWLPLAFALKRRLLSAMRGGATRSVKLKSTEKRVA